MYEYQKKDIKTEYRAVKVSSLIRVDKRIRKRFLFFFSEFGCWNKNLSITKILLNTNSKCPLFFDNIAKAEAWISNELKQEQIKYFENLNYSKPIILRIYDINSF